VSIVTAAAAGSWKLGDKTVSRMGFGAMQLPQRGQPFAQGAAPLDRGQAIAVLREAVRLGITHIDTAAFYFSARRSANELISAALAPYPDDLVIATKVGPDRDRSGQWASAATPGEIRGHVEENLRQLGRDHLDLVYLRCMRSMADPAEHFGVLAGLREAGLIRHLGISGATPAQLAAARQIAPVVSVQNRYAIGAGAAEHQLADDCGAAGIAFVPFFSVGGGRLDAEFPEVLAIARHRSVSAAQVRLAWALRRGPHLLVIPGTRDLAHLADNVAAGALELAPAEMARLSACRAPAARQA
jgi:aryl-alcohol dehydrogenase-like predicted oxidoreductase